MSDTDDRLVLSEVHIGSSALDEEAEMVSRYRYLTPSRNNDDSSSSSSSDSDAERSAGSDIKRRRKRPRGAASKAVMDRTSQRRSRPAHEVLTIVHRMATTLDLVGQQVWSAAFLLGDFVLTHEELFAGMQVLELGAGPGLPGLVAARVARKCYLTDYHHEVLALLSRNAEANRHLFGNDGSALAAIISTASTAKTVGAERATDTGFAAACGSSNSSCHHRHGDRGGGAVVAVRELDWFAFSATEKRTDAAYSPAAACSSVEESSQLQDKLNKPGTRPTPIEENRKADNEHEFAWRKGEVGGLLSPSGEKTDGLVILAADVIYDEGLTEALFDVLKVLMPTPLAQHRSNHSATNHTIKSSTREGGSTSSNTDTGGSRTADLDRIHVTVGEPIACTTPGSDVGNTGNRNSLPTQRCAHVRAAGEAVLYLALEKRFNFSLAELSVAATGYNALLRNVVDVTDVEGEVVVGCAQEQKAFEGARLPLSFPQCFQYKRSAAMEIWKIRRRPAAICNPDVE